MLYMVSFWRQKTTIFLYFVFSFPVVYGLVLEAKNNTNSEFIGFNTVVYGLVLEAKNNILSYYAYSSIVVYGLVLEAKNNLPISVKFRCFCCIWSRFGGKKQLGIMNFGEIKTKRQAVLE